MSRELTRAEELIQKIQSNPELLEKLTKMTKDEALEMARELGYGDVTETEIMEVLCNDKDLSDKSLEAVAGGRSEEESLVNFMNSICG